MSRLVWSLVGTIFFGIIIFPKRLLPYLDSVPLLTILSEFTVIEWAKYFILFCLCYFMTGETALKLLDKLEQKFRGN
ncbi:hypothetical protein ACO0K0_07240 [Undibacterium sp. SXout11W]|uniref:hypothetical protein n=1 Tax=Undibacterium sp. SXout11W TaxID=3413050 RepID=UPI003BF30F4F